ncbi:MAG: hypothetical protein J2P15_24450, partial [Micromonosporaceae bacterium]|nr:hypothetical protein [Micromonosporaceae bacterium]
YGGLVTDAAAAVVAAAVAVPALIVREGATGGRTPVGAPGANSQGALVVPLRYRPTWLPAGLTEHSRDAPIPPLAWDTMCLVRVWARAPLDSRPDSVLNAHLDLAICRDTNPNHDPVTGYTYQGGLGKSYVTFRIGEDTMQVIQEDLNLSQDQMERIARSVRADPSVMTVPLRTDWLPMGGRVNEAVVGGASPAAWQVQLTTWLPPTVGAVSAPPHPSGSEIQIKVDLGATTDAPDGGQPLAIGGHPARLVIRHYSELPKSADYIKNLPAGLTTDLPAYTVRYLVVELGGGRLLTVRDWWVPTAPSGVDDLKRIAAGAAQVQPPDVSWIGKP